MPRVFWDMEFSGLRQTAKPISIACLTDEVPLTFYAEFDGWREDECSDFVIDNVLPKLKYREAPWGEQPAGIQGAFNYKGDRYAVALALHRWLAAVHSLGHGEQIEMWGDVPAYDWVLFAELFYGILPSFVCYIPFDIATLMKVKGVDPDINRREFLGMERYGEHEALQDAAAIGLCYAKLMEDTALYTAATAALDWIDDMYPPDIFDGSSGDEGPVRIVKIRENLREALRKNDFI